MLKNADFLSFENSAVVFILLMNVKTFMSINFMLSYGEHRKSCMVRKPDWADPQTELSFCWAQSNTQAYIHSVAIIEFPNQLSRN